MKTQVFLNRFWRCTDMKYEGDEFLEFEVKHKDMVNDHTFLSGLHLEFEYREPELPGYIVCDKWDLSRENFMPERFATAIVQSVRSIRNGLVVVTGGNPQSITTYTFKKIKFNPLQEQKILRKRAAETSDMALE